MESLGSDNDGRTNQKRRSGWPKALDIFLRVCHVGTSSVLFGGVVWAVPFTRLSTWHHLAIATGIALIILNIYKCRHWPYQGRGLMAELHVGSLWLVHIRPELMVSVLVTVLAAGVIGSHMPAYLRHWSLVHGRRID